MKSARAASSLVVLARVAAADPKAAADETFERGRSLMQQKKFPEACAAFEQSQRLDPQLGTLFNLADCEVQLGKIAAAWKIYRELATTDANEDRRAFSAAEAIRLEKKMPKLVITIPAHPAGAKVTVDGSDSTGLLGIKTPVDLGEHAIDVTAPGFREWQETVVVHAGDIAKVQVGLEPLDAQEAPSPTYERPVAPTDGSRARHGKLALIAGASAVGAGLIFGAATWLEWNHAEAASGADKTSGARDARILGDASTTLVVVGLASAGVGVYLWQTSSTSAVVAPRAGADGAGVTLSGSF
jgi:tetratricopeptide (TPR) repeat protein